MVIPQSSLDQVLVLLLPVIRQYLAKRLTTTDTLPPFVLGLTGLQGSGKSTWADALAVALQEQHQYKVINVSLDDFYHDHETLVRIRRESGGNPLLQTRGQPGTHDVRLATDFFAALSQGREEVRIPRFDKARFDGEGDRVPQEEWQCVTPPIDVIIFEGWCLGFQALHSQDLTARWQRSRQQKDKDIGTQQAQGRDPRFTTETLADIDLQYLLAVNTALETYNKNFMAQDRFNSFVHLDTDDLENVYRWRLDQEHALWRARGAGMTDEAVIKFVRGYMPSYELYLDRLRRQSFAEPPGCHLRVILDKQRNVNRVECI
ncbi:hypothetical protein VTK73DRAFT_229 [Phialemonium thermophilum]|uniref:D-glycerate 3-kinase n=1 Tax=Phialemonium thermophilum TaxID=223376 RepID=A0ABR3XGC6_9PEZI